MSGRSIIITAVTLFIGKVIKEIYTDIQRNNNQQKRKNPKKYNSEKFGFLMSDNTPVEKKRSEVFSGKKVKPKVGSLLAVNLGMGVLDHTSIYIGYGYVIEQHGNNELRKIKLKEFLKGDNNIIERATNISIQIACDEFGTPLRKKHVADNAKQMYADQDRRTQEYSILFNNCHQFCWHCISGDQNSNITLFSTLEEKVAAYYGYSIYWDEVDL